MGEHSVGRVKKRASHHRRLWDVSPDTRGRQRTEVDAAAQSVTPMKQSFRYSVIERATKIAYRSRSRPNSALLFSLGTLQRSGSPSIYVAAEFVEQGLKGRVLLLGQHCGKPVLTLDEHWHDGVVGGAPLGR